MSKNILFIITVLVIVGIVAFLLVSDSKEEVFIPVVETNTPSEGGEGTFSTSVSGAQGTFEDYSPEKVAQEGDVVLFFHASWCPTCRALEGDIEKNEIPEGITILKVDFDTSTELRQKYGVTTQHTLVQVDAEGNLIQKWSGGNRLSTIINRL